MRANTGIGLPVALAVWVFNHPSMAALGATRNVGAAKALADVGSDGNTGREQPEPLASYCHDQLRGSFSFHPKVIYNILIGSHA